MMIGGHHAVVSCRALVHEDAFAGCVLGHDASRWLGANAVHHGAVDRSGAEGHASGVQVQGWVSGQARVGRYLLGGHWNRGAAAVVEPIRKQAT